MKFFFSLFIIPFFLSTAANTSTNTLIWGKTGHRVVGQVASFYLNKKAKKAVNGILEGESMAIASIWMDQIKSDPKWDYTHTWHYVTIPNGKTYAETKKNPKGDIVQATRRIIKELKKGGLSHKRQKIDLKMLIHLVGDVHQPLHVGNGKDRGGNEIDMRYMHHSTNLHRLWDSGMIDQSQLSYTELAKAVNNISKEQVQKWQNSKVIDWVNESKNLRSKVYNIPKDHNIGYKYKYKHWDLVKKRLVQAGVRLAGVLNNIYG